jgi:tRNA (guanine26-N2/guanine27-N2)-dimethyltransferase
MAEDRDLEVALGAALAGPAPPTARAWEMTAATGVRGLRLLNEAGGFAELLLTEAHPLAARVLDANAARYAAQGARARHHDARRPVDDGPFDLVDLDPYGSPAPYLAAALAAVRPGGLLAVTATDLRVLAGVEPGAAERRYGGRPVRGRLGPEGGLRLLLAWVDRGAAAGGLGIDPVLAYVRDHHVRAYVRVGPATARRRVETIDPATWDGPPLPPGGGLLGPLWTGPLLDPTVVGRLLVPASAARPRELGRRLERLRGEAAADVPFFYESNEIARRLGLPRPPPVDRLIEEVRAMGHRAARTQVREGAFRTTAPRSDVERAAAGIAGR